MNQPFACRSAGLGFMAANSCILLPGRFIVGVRIWEPRYHSPALHLEPFSATFPIHSLFRGLLHHCEKCKIANKLFDTLRKRPRASWPKRVPNAILCEYPFFMSSYLSFSKSASLRDCHEVNHRNLIRRRWTYRSMLSLLERGQEILRMDAFHRIIFFSFA